MVLLSNEVQSNEVNEELKLSKRSYLFVRKYVCVYVCERNYYLVCLYIHIHVYTVFIPIFTHTVTKNIVRF